MRQFIYILFTILLTPIFSQNGIKDSVISFPAFGIHGNVQFPLGDLAMRYGQNFAAGGSFCYKTERNLIFDLNFTYLFGTKIKESGFLSNLLTSDNFVINKDGNISDIVINQRGFYLTTGIGKIWSHKKIAKNPNSGIFTSINLGYLQHKIKLYDLSRKTVQIENEYVKGYDRLTAGPCVNLFLGYLFFGNKKLLNFKAGIDFTYSATKSLRKFNFDTFEPDTKRRNDMLIGLKFEWILPIYKSSGKDFYYY